MKFESRTVNLLSAVLCLSIIIKKTFEAIDPSSDFTKKCFHRMLESHGMAAIQVPIVGEPANLSMCPLINQSCCVVKDQQVMYANFVTGGEEQAIVNHFTTAATTYNELLNNLVKVQAHATLIKNVIKKKRSNCKFMAERIINYQIDTVISKIQTNIENQQNFLINTYKGFYCGICNFENHRYFNLFDQKLTISQQFCRKIVKNTLPNLLLIQVDIVKLVNLVTTFLTHCNFKGEYLLDAIYPKELNFTSNETITTMLKSCRDNRNKKDWLPYCKDICSEYKLTKYPRFFETNQRLVDFYNQYLTAKFAEIEFEKSTHHLFNDIGAGAVNKNQPGINGNSQNGNNQNGNNQNGFNQNGNNQNGFNQNGNNQNGFNQNGNNQNGNNYNSNNHNGGNYNGNNQNGINSNGTNNGSSNGTLTVEEVIRRLKTNNSSALDDINGIYRPSQQISVTLSNFKTIVSEFEGGIEFDIDGESSAISEANFNAVQKRINLMEKASAGSSGARNLRLVDIGEDKPERKLKRKGGAAKKTITKHNAKKGKGRKLSAKDVKKRKSSQTKSRQLKSATLWKTLASGFGLLLVSVLAAF